MHFIKHDGTKFELYVESFSQRILINFQLIEKSNGKFASVDRGQRTDRYSTTLAFNRDTEYISEMIMELNLLRDNKKEVVLSSIEERVFGDNVDHSVNLVCIVSSIGIQSSTGLKTQGTDITLLLQDPSYVPGYELPSTTKCLQSGWKGYSTWNTHINETYNRNNYFVDRVVDKYVFNGEYVLTVNDNANLLNYWRVHRGEEFTIADGDFGVDNMFGPDGGNGPHTVIITNITYKYNGPTYRQTKIEMLKVG